MTIPVALPIKSGPAATSPHHREGALAMAALAILNRKRAKPPPEPEEPKRKPGRPTGSLGERDPFDNPRDDEFCALVLAQGGLPRREWVIDGETGVEKLVEVGPANRIWRHTPLSCEAMDALRAELLAKRARDLPETP